MRSLVLKLPLAFLCVGLIGAVFLALVVRQRTQVEFDQFVKNRDESRIVEILSDYYQTNESWTGVERIFTQIGNFTQSKDAGIRRLLQSLVVILVDSDEIAIYSNRPGYVGKVIPSHEIRLATPIEMNGELVGWLITRPAPNLFERGIPERNFIASINKAILTGALAAVLVALLLGGFLAYTITRTLCELTTATQKVAAGDLGYQVEVRSKDELGELATSFNQMSADLAQSNQTRRQMTADIAHDLRSPLSVILGYTEALSDGKLEGSPDVYKVMHTEAGQLSHLIDDLRMLSLADSGELPMNFQPIAPYELLRDIARVYARQAERKNITLSVDADTDLQKVKVDPNRMTQVLGNLMSNALRYTPEGGEIVLGGSSENGFVSLFVRDNGSGIPEEELPFIFNRFYRSDKARQQSGETGLGLAIAKSLVELQGGSISAESEVGGGTTIVMFLPV